MAIRRFNKVSDLGYASDANPVADLDNIYLSDLGWARRHYTNDLKTEYFDVIIMAGDTDPADLPDPFLSPNPKFEVGDGTPS